MKTKNLAWLASLMVMIASCSNSLKYKEPESFESKIGRYKNKSDYLGSSPEYHVMDMNTEAFRPTPQRGPASATSDSANTLEQNNEINSYTYKTSYFMAMYTQYQTLSQMIQVKPLDFSICPSFHSALVDYQSESTNRSDLTINFSLDKNTWDNRYLALFPELMLPVTSDGTKPTVADYLKNNNITDVEQIKNIMKQAIVIHTSKLSTELKYLCEHGASSNYYKFENLLTEIHQQKTFGPSEKNASILFKTTFFSNLALLNSLTYQKAGRSIASSNTSSHELINQMNLGWVRTYLREMNQRK